MPPASPLPLWGWVEKYSFGQLSKQKQCKIMLAHRQISFFPSGDFCFCFSVFVSDLLHVREHVRSIIGRIARQYIFPTISHFISPTYRNLRCTQELEKGLQRSQRRGLNINTRRGQLNMTKGALQLPGNFLSRKVDIG